MYIVVRQEYGMGHNYDADELYLDSVQAFSDLAEAVGAAEAYRATGKGVACILPSESEADLTVRKELQQKIKELG